MSKGEKIAFVSIGILTAVGIAYLLLKKKNQQTLMPSTGASGDGSNGGAGNGGSILVMPSTAADRISKMFYQN